MDPSNVSRRFLRIGLNETARMPSRPVTFGRLPLANTDQYYFDFHPIARELLLHDMSGITWQELLQGQLNKGMEPSERSSWTTGKVASITLASER